jgi:hypothetical protein
MIKTSVLIFNLTYVLNFFIIKEIKIIYEKLYIKLNSKYILYILDQIKKCIFLQKISKIPEISNIL